MSRASIIVVSGLSGAGKSSVLKILEDFNFLCLDNFPPPLVRQLIDLKAARTQDRERPLALGVDIRWADFLPEMRETLLGLKAEGNQVHILFLDATVEVLVKRFSETRRRHPLGKGDLLAHIQKEREDLQPLKELADMVLDTSQLSHNQLRRTIRNQIRFMSSAPAMSVHLISFGFKNGLPINADMVLDVRFLPNPFYRENLRHHTGLEACVREFILSHREAPLFLKRIKNFFAFLLPRFVREGKSYLQIAIGCTGGRHRSVCMVEEIFQAFKNQADIALTRHHRDIHRT